MLDPLVKSLDISEKSTFATQINELDDAASIDDLSSFSDKVPPSTLKGKTTPQQPAQPIFVVPPFQRVVPLLLPDLPLLTLKDSSISQGFAASHHALGTDHTRFLLSPGRNTDIDAVTVNPPSFIASFEAINAAKAAAHAATDGAHNVSVTKERSRWSILVSWERTQKAESDAMAQEAGKEAGLDGSKHLRSGESGVAAESRGPNVPAVTAAVVCARIIKEGAEDKNVIEEKDKDVVKTKDKENKEPGKSAKKTSNTGCSIPIDFVDPAAPALNLCLEHMTYGDYESTLLGLGSVVLPKDKKYYNSMSSAPSYYYPHSAHKYYKPIDVTLSDIQQDDVIRQLDFQRVGLKPGRKKISVEKNGQQMPVVLKQSVSGVLENKEVESSFSLAPSLLHDSEKNVEKDDRKKKRKRDANPLIYNLNGKIGLCRIPNEDTETNEIFKNSSLTTLPHKASKDTTKSNISAIHRALAPFVDIFSGMIILQRVVDFIASLVPPVYRSQAISGYIRQYVLNIYTSAPPSEKDCGSASSGGRKRTGGHGHPLDYYSGDTEDEKTTINSSTTSKFEGKRSLFGVGGKGITSAFAQEWRTTEEGTRDSDGGGRIPSKVWSKSNLAHVKSAASTMTLLPSVNKSEGTSSIQRLALQEKESVLFSNTASVRYVCVIAAINELLGPPPSPDPSFSYMEQNQEKPTGAILSARLCFDLMDEKKRGYLLHDDIQARKNDGVVTEDFNFTVVQGILKAFKDIKHYEDERFRLLAIRRRRGMSKKKKNMPYLPKMLQFHMSLDEFTHILCTDSFIALAFLPYLVKSSVSGALKEKVEMPNFYGRSQVIETALLKNRFRDVNAANNVLKKHIEAVEAAKKERRKMNQ